MSTALSKCSIAVKEHLGGNYQLMCHAPVALDVTAAAFVPDTEGVQVSTGTLTLVGIHRDVTEEFQGEYTFYLAPTTTVL